jgi:hypothetical protein
LSSTPWVNAHAKKIKIAVRGIRSSLAARGWKGTMNTADESDDYRSI